MKAALKPVLVDSTYQDDDVTLLEAQLSLILWLEVIQGFTLRLSCSKRHKTVMRDRGRGKQKMLSFCENNTWKFPFDKVSSCIVLYTGWKVTISFQ